MPMLMVLLIISPRGGFSQGESIVQTKHNLSASGPGAVRAVSEDRICVFCHTPHESSSDAPLWNRRASSAAYIPYDSPTLVATPGQPTGASKLCLSCHDGTIALGDVLSESTPIAMAGGGIMPPGPGLIGTDLRDDHPISFPYTDSYSQLSSDLAPPNTWDDRVQLDDQGMLQCTTCHDPHKDIWGKFLVMDNTGAALCQECHTMDLFGATPHATSGRSWNGRGANPWSHTRYRTVAANACLNCHLSHHAPGDESLLTRELEEDVCLACHDGSVARTNMNLPLQKTFRHPVRRTFGSHRGDESPREASMHVECVDCHNPHVVREGPAQAPYIQSVMAGVRGVNIGGVAVEEAVYEYEVCFKCHGQQTSPSLFRIERQVGSSNLLRKFSPTSPSFHPVAAPGKNGFVPSLISPLNASSMIYCSDCHGNNSDLNPAMPSGPHGSDFEYMLAREYRTGREVTESPTAYALCYQCHDRQSILGDESFPTHRLHVMDKRTPCSVCHDPHGIDLGEGSEIGNAHLINFDMSIVEPDPVTRRLEYQSFGPGMGQCNLRCHGKDHSPASYP